MSPSPFRLFRQLFLLSFRRVLSRAFFLSCWKLLQVFVFEYYICVTLCLSYEVFFFSRKIAFEVSSKCSNAWRGERWKCANCPRGGLQSVTESVQTRVVSRKKKIYAYKKHSFHLILCKQFYLIFINTGINVTMPYNRYVLVLVAIWDMFYFSMDSFVKEIFELGCRLVRIYLLQSCPSRSKTYPILRPKLKHIS